MAQGTGARMNLTTSRTRDANGFYLDVELYVSPEEATLIREHSLADSSMDICPKGFGFLVSSFWDFTRPNFWGSTWWPMHLMQLSDIIGKRTRFGFRSAQDLEGTEPQLVDKVKALKQKLEQVLEQVAKEQRAQFELAKRRMQTDAI